MDNFRSHDIILTNIETKLDLHVSPAISARINQNRLTFHPIAPPACPANPQAPAEPGAHLPDATLAVVGRPESSHHPGRRQSQHRARPARAASKPARPAGAARAAKRGRVAAAKSLSRRQNPPAPRKVRGLLRHPARAVKQAALRIRRTRRNPRPQN